MKDELKVETYSIRLECSNCDEPSLLVDIPVGEPVRTYVEFETCPNCKVKSLHRLYLNP